MIKVNNAEIDILQEEWDVLVILDACRFEVFEEVYKKSLKKKGELKKAKTFSEGTKDWMTSNIKGRDCSDIIYIDPIIMFNKWLPNNNFFKVDEVWKYGWDYNYGTILPEQMTESALKQIKDHPDKRIIIHYHQPHPPFLDPAFRKIRKNIVTPKSVQDLMNSKTKNKSHTLSHFIQGNMRKILGAERAWRLMIWARMEPLDEMGQTYKHFGMDGIMDAYKKNMILVLNNLNKILLNVNKKIIITSDHSFNYDRSTKALKKRYVPWLEMN